MKLTKQGVRDLSTPHNGRAQETQEAIPCQFGKHELSHFDGAKRDRNGTEMRCVWCYHVEVVGR